MHKSLRFILYGVLLIIAFGALSTYVDNILFAVVALALISISWLYRQTIVDALKSLFKGGR